MSLNKNKSLYNKKKSNFTFETFCLIVYRFSEKKVEKLVKKTKIIRKTENKHLFKKSLKKAKRSLSNFIIERVVI
jgi:hypothetical protein